MRPRLNLPPPIVPIFWGLFFLEATFGAYLSIWPLWIERLGAPVAVIGFILGAGGFLRLFVLAPSATVADRVGYRRTIVIARFVAVAGFIAAAISTHWSQLLLAVAALAIGEMVFPLLQTIVASESGEHRMRSFALVFNVGPSIALAISPLMGAGVVALFGMRSALLLAAVYSALSIAFLARIVEPESIPAANPGANASYRSTIADPGMRLVGLLLTVTIFSLSLGVAFIPTFLEDIRGFDPSAIAALTALPALGSAAFGMSVARIAVLQRSPFVASVIPLALMAIAFMIFRGTAWLPVLVIAFVFRGGLFSTWAILMSALGELAPPALRSRSFALLEMFGGVAFSLGPMVAGLLYAMRETLPFELATILALALAPAYVLSQRIVNTMHRNGSPPEDSEPGGRCREAAPVPEAIAVERAG